MHFCFSEGYNNNSVFWTHIIFIFLYDCSSVIIDKLTKEGLLSAAGRDVYSINKSNVRYVWCLFSFLFSVTLSFSFTEKKTLISLSTASEYQFGQGHCEGRDWSARYGDWRKGAQNYGRRLHVHEGDWSVSYSHGVKHLPQHIKVRWIRHAILTSVITGFVLLSSNGLCDNNKAAEQDAGGS